MTITKGEVDKIQEALEIGSKAIDHLQSELALKDSRIRELEDKNDYDEKVHESKLQHYEGLFKELSNKISDLEEQNKALAETVAKLQILRGEQDVKISDLEEDMSKLMENCAKAINQIADLKTENQTLREENERLKQNNQAVKKLYMEDTARLRHMRIHFGAFCNTGIGQPITDAQIEVTKQVFKEYLEQHKPCALPECWKECKEVCAFEHCKKNIQG